MDIHIYKEFRKCKKFLKNNDDTFVTKAEKSQVTIMDKFTYIDQMTKILDNDNI